jgi:hypothetical protein
MPLINVPQRNRMKQRSKRAPIDLLSSQSPRNHNYFDPFETRLLELIYTQSPRRVMRIVMFPSLVFVFVTRGLRILMTPSTLAIPSLSIR